MKQYLLPLLLGCACQASAQIGSASGMKYAGASGVQADYVLYDAGNRPIPINDHSDIQGNPFFQSEWSYGTIKMQNGNTIADSSLNYSLYTNKLYVKRDKAVFQLPGSITEFYLKDGNDKSKDTFHYFRNSFPAVEGHDESTFYEVLFSSDSLQLLKWAHKKLQQQNDYNATMQYKYLPVDEYYLYSKKENKIEYLDTHLKVSRLRKKLPSYAEQFEKYASSSHRAELHENELVQILSM